jgi:hypothetical protein
VRSLSTPLARRCLWYRSTATPWLSS